MKQITLFLFCCACYIHGSFAQTTTATLRGKITTTDGKPAPFITVSIKHTSLGALSNDKGEFIIRHVPAGKHTLKISAIGIAAQEKQVTLSPGQTLDLDFLIMETAEQLKEVIIKTSRNVFAGKESDDVAKLPLKNIENPQVYNVVPKALIKEQMLTNFDDALKNAAGVNRLWSSTGRSGDGAGYFSMRGFAVQPTMVNGIAGPVNSGIDPANIENIEVIKGPSGTLFGSSLVSFGGLINIVTKKPYDHFGGEASYTIGSYNLNRATLDINVPVTPSGDAAFRVNTAYNYQGSFQDAGFNEHFFLAPGLSYKVNDRLSFLINTEFLSSEGTNPLMVFLNRSRPLIARTPAALGMDFNRSYTSNDITIRNNSTNINGRMNYRISKAWISQTNVSRSTRTAKGYYSYIMFLEPDNDTLISRYLTKQNSTDVTTDIQQNFVGDFTIGSFRNRLVAGLDYLNLQSHNNNTGYILFDKVNVQQKDDPRYSELSQPAVDARLSQNTSLDRSGSQSSTYSAYASDVLNITDRLSAMLSLRIDRFENKGDYDYSRDTVTGKYGQTALSPKFGLVYEIVKDQVSLFGNYMNGFQNVAPVIQPLPDVSGSFKPQSVNQWEGGIKVDAFDHKVSLTASYYHILLGNALRSETIEREGKSYNITVQDGSQRSSGIEFELIANPVPGLNILAGYSYNDSKSLKTTPTYEGRRPTAAGPANLANAWISYTLLNGSAKGLGFGFGGNYAGKNLITDSKPTSTFILPAYTVLNATVFYDTHQWRIGLKLDNLTDKRYFGGWTTVEPQMPRSLSGSITFKF
jgi:iron complex outermembrane receptor protein